MTVKLSGKMFDQWHRFTAWYSGKFRHSRRGNRPPIALLFFLVAGAAGSFVCPAGAGEEFDLSKHSVPLKQIMSGGPSKDGIPALSAPKFVPAGKVDFLSAGDRVVSLVIGEEAKAYPLRIMNWHEVVNDKVGGKSVAVSYCPLTGSAVVYDRSLAGEGLSFGVSGRLYESNLLLYDRESESLWSQLKYEAVAGPLTGRRLMPLVSRVTSWAGWQAAHPDGLVLSPETGYKRDYSRNPYASYETSEYLMFPVVPQDRRLLPKEKVFGIVAGGKARAYPLSRLAEAHGQIEDSLGSAHLVVTYDPVSTTVESTSDGRPAVGVVAYWFAWFAFHPQTEIWGQRPLLTEGAGERLVVREDKGSWSSLLGIMGGELHRGDSDIYIITGELENVSNKDLAYARLLFELIGSDGKILFREYGYNRGAERLRDPEFEFGHKPAREMGVSPIKAGSKDRFRMIFFTDEIPRFHHYRIRIAEAPFDQVTSRHP